MESQMRISTIVVLFAVSPCLMAAQQKIVPGIFGDDEWKANPKFDKDTDSFWVVVNYPKTTNGQCEQDVMIGGKQVFDSLKLPCSTIPVVFADKKEMIVGNKIYSKTPGSAVFVTPEHTCIEKFYAMDSTNTLKIRKKAMSTLECSYVRRDMKAALTEMGYDQLGGETHPLWNKFMKKLHEEFADIDSNGSADANSNDLPQSGSPTTMSGFIKLDSDPYIQEDGNLVKKIKLDGLRIKDEFVVPAAENTVTSANGDNIIIGNILYIEKPGKLIVFSGNSCFLKDYTGGDPRPQQQSEQRCKEVQSKIRSVTGSSGYIYGVISDNTSSGAASSTGAAQFPDGSVQPPVTTPQFTNSLGGFSISASAPYTSANGQRKKVITVKVPGATNGESFEIPASESTGVSFIGSKAYIGNRFYSDTPGTLVVLNENQCLLKRYSGNDPPKTEDITASEKCQTIRTEIRKLRGGMGSSIINNQRPQSNQKPQTNQAAQQLNQRPQSNQSPQNNQVSQTNQRPQNNQVAQQLIQRPQTNQRPQNDQTALNNQVAQQLSQVANSLLKVVNRLAKTLGTNGQPNRFLASMGKAISNIVELLNQNSQGGLGNVPRSNASQ